MSTVENHTPHDQTEPLSLHTALDQGMLDPTEPAYVRIVYYRGDPDNDDNWNIEYDPTDMLYPMPGETHKPMPDDPQIYVVHWNIETGHKSVTPPLRESVLRYINANLKDEAEEEAQQSVEVGTDDIDKEFADVYQALLDQELLALQESFFYIYASFRGDTKRPETWELLPFGGGAKLFAGDPNKPLLPADPNVIVVYRNFNTGESIACEPLRLSQCDRNDPVFTGLFEPMEPPY